MSTSPRPNKRPKTLISCQQCRTKKLSCDGERPCARCSRNRLECSDGERTERTPLTRKRMTELEEKLDDFGHVWTALFPTQPFDDVRDSLRANGLEATLQRLRWDQHTAVPKEDHHVARDDTARSSIGYPITRPASPHDLPLRLDLSGISTEGAVSHDWHENEGETDQMPHTSPDQLSNFAATPGNDFGTGVSGAIGYIGLSSGSTLLRVVGKFAPYLSSMPRPGSGPYQPSPFSPAALPAPLPNGLRHDRSAGRPILPPAKEVGRLLESFFQYFHAFIPIVHEPTIRAQVMGAMPLPTGTGSHVLFNMIFATGAFDVALDPGDDDGSRYYELARAALQRDLFDGGSVMLVQGLAIMALYLQRTGKPNKGYICLGFAIRMAMALGIHISPPEPQQDYVNVLDTETRCRLWWCLVTLETGQSMTYGRPHSVNLGCLVTSRLPLNVDDADITVSTIKRPTNDDGVTVYTALIMQAMLSQALLQLLDRISRSRPAPTVEQIKWCGENFKAKLDSFPHFMHAEPHGPRILGCAVQRWRAREYRALLYRPVLLSAAWDNSATASSNPLVREVINTCRDLASQNLQDIATYVRAHPDPHRGGEWFALYFAMQASLPLLLSLVWEPHHSDARFWRSLLEDLVAWLGTLRSMQKLGSTYASILTQALLSTPQHGLAAGRSETGHPEEIPPLLDHGNIINYERFFSEIWNFEDCQFEGFESLL